MNSYESSSSEEESDERDFQELGLKPFRFEPKTDASHAVQRTLETFRAGNISWCTCGVCRVMETETESLCCQDEGAVSARIERFLVRKYTLSIQ